MSAKNRRQRIEPLASGTKENGRSLEILPLHGRRETSVRWHFRRIRLGSLIVYCSHFLILAHLCKSLSIVLDHDN